MKEAKCKEIIPFFKEFLAKHTGNLNRSVSPLHSTSDFLQETSDEDVDSDEESWRTDRALPELSQETKDFIEQYRMKMYKQSINLEFLFIFLWASLICCSIIKMQG